jgi:hypothetical protein
LKPEKLKVSSVELRNLSVGDKFDAVNAIDQTLVILKDIKVDSASDLVAKNMEVVEKTATTAASHTDKPFLLHLSKFEKDFMSNVGGDTFKRPTGGKLQSDAEHQYRIAEVAGGKRIVITFTGKSLTGFSEAVFTGVNVMITGSSKVTQSEEAIAAWDKQKIIHVAEECVKAADYLIAMKDAYRTASKLITKMKKEVETTIEILDSLPTSNNPGVRKVIMLNLHSLSSSVTAPYTLLKTVQSQLLATINSALNVCLKSMSHHKED